MKTFLLSVLFLSMVSLPAFSDSITVLGGYVLPKGDSDVFKQNELETTFKVDDLNDFGVYVGYDHFLGNFVNLTVGLSFYQSDTNVVDRDFEFPNGNPIQRNIALQIMPLEAGVRFLPAGREAPVIPYVGGGVGAYFWQYEEVGDFIINRNTNFSPITGRAFSDGTDFGWHVEGGIQIPVSRSATITAEAKYFKVEGNLDELSFDPLFEPLDLSATMFSAGVSFWF